MVLLLGIIALVAGQEARGWQGSGAARGNPPSKPEESQLWREIRHQLQVLPYYAVFDYIDFSLDGGKVTLRGQVLRPTLKADAEAAIKSIEGVSSVNNQIGVLPKSSGDDELRRAVYRAVFEDSELQRYASQAVPSIHILVVNGAITLEGFVFSDADRKLAASRAGSAAGGSAVQNNLSIRAKSLAGDRK